MSGYVTDDETGSPVLGSKAFLILFGSMFSFALDQFSKFWVTAAFRVEESLAVFPGLFSITYKTNPGAAFGIFRGRPVPFFLIISFIAIICILVFVFKTDGRRRRLMWAMALILGGAAGNLADRLREGSVVDFLDFHYNGWMWPTFNVADVSILAGVFLFLADILKHEMRRSKIEKVRRSGDFPCG